MIKIGDCEQNIEIMKNSSNDQKLNFNMNINKSNVVECLEMTEI